VGRTIQVTSAQVNAARLWIERADRAGAPVPDGIRKLANARPRPILRDTSATGALPPASRGAGTVDEPPSGHLRQPDDRQH
jgi:hypothetical protein